MDEEHSYGGFVIHKMNVHTTDSDIEDIKDRELSLVKNILELISALHQSMVGIKNDKHVLIILNIILW